jgi:hypothetical protein
VLGRRYLRVTAVIKPRAAIRLPKAASRDSPQRVKAGPMRQQTPISDLHGKCTIFP